MITNKLVQSAMSPLSVLLVLVDWFRKLWTKGNGNAGDEWRQATKANPDALETRLMETIDEY